MNIYVSNLSFNVQNQDLKDLFAPYGEVTSATVINDKTTGRSRGFGFVEIANDEDAKKAIAELDNSTVEDRVIKVSEAKPREDRDSGSFKRNSPFRSDNGGGFKKNRW